MNAISRLGFYGVQLNSASLEKTRAFVRYYELREQFFSHPTIIIHQLNRTLLKRYSMDYIKGFWSALRRPYYVLYDMSGGKGSTLTDEDFQNFVRLYMEFAKEGATLTLAGGVGKSTVGHYVNRLRPYGFDPRSLAVDAESSVLVDDELCVEKLKGFYGAVDKHIIKS